MKFRNTTYLLISALFITVFMFSGTSCSQKTSATKGRIAYDRSDRIKVYKSNSNRNSFSHSKTVRKKYVIK